MWKPGWIFLCNACGSVKEFTVSAEYWRGNCPGFFQTRSGALGKVCLAYAREKLYNG